MEYETSEVGKTYLRLTKIAFPNLPLTFEIGLLPTTTPVKNMTSSIGIIMIIIPKTNGQIKIIFQTTNQLWYIQLVGGFNPYQKY